MLLKTRVLLTVWFLFSVSLCAPLDLGLGRDTILKISVEGNDKVSAADVYFAIELKPGAPVDGENIQKAVNAIYGMGCFYDVGASVRDFENGKELVFKVVENETVENIEIIGNDTVKTKSIVAVMETKVGQIFKAPLLNEDIKRISDLYSKRGFILSSVSDAEVLERGKTIRLTCTEGRLEAIKIEGNEYTKDHVIRREFNIKPGDIYNERRVRRSLQNIFNLGYFENVTRKHEPGTEAGNVILVVEVKEQKTGTAGIGGSISASKKFVGFVEVSKNNFRGKGQTLKLKIEFGDITNYQLSFVEPWLRGKPVSLGVDIYRTRTTDYLYDGFGNIVDDYEKHVTGGSIMLGKKLGEFTSGSIRFTDEDITIKPVELGVQGGRYQSLLGTISRDTRDNVMNPSSGLHDSLMIETTGGFLKGPNAFSKYKLDLRRYISIAKNDVIALRSVYGFIDVNDGILPIYHEWGVGGAHTVRGYRLREFTGREMLVLNLELRHSFNRTVEGVLFYDAGDTNTSRSSGFNLKRGFGVGVHLKTPIGLIRLDYGKGEGDRSPRTYFSMGKMF